MILSILSAVFSEAVRLFFEITYRYPGSLVPKVLMVITVLGCLGIGRFGYLLFKFSTPQKRMRQIGQAVAAALEELGELEDPQHSRVETESLQGAVISVELKGGTMRDKTTFAVCMEEIWGVIDNPRYLLVRGRKPQKAKEFYAVPEIFGKHKDRVYVFEKHIRKALGRFQTVYTRTPEGRKVLLRARTRSFVNKNQTVLQGRKVVKGEYE